MVEEPLAGGNATAGVVRVGETVRKPWLSSTPAVARLMAVVQDAGIDVPAHLGADAAGRQSIEFVPGRMAMDLLPLSDGDLRRVGALIRSIHDACTDVPLDDGWEPALIPAPHSDLLCHNDLTPWNLVMGERWVFIDWDAVGPSSRLWDLAYSAQAFAGIAEGVPVEAAAARLAAIIDGYAPADELRAALPATLGPRAAAMHAMLRNAAASGVEPWSTMFTEGHGAYWAGVAEYARTHEAEWARALDV